MKTHRVFDCTMQLEVMQGTLKECNHHVRTYRGYKSLKVEPIQAAESSVRLEVNSTDERTVRRKRAPGIIG